MWRIAIAQMVKELIISIAERVRARRRGRRKQFKDVKCPKCGQTILAMWGDGDPAGYKWLVKICPECYYRNNDYS